MHGLYDHITTKNLLTPCVGDKTRGHNFKLFKKTTKTKLAQFFFTNRIVKAWNGLTNETVNAKSLNVFKNSIDRHFQSIIYAVNFTKLDQ